MTVLGVGKESTRARGVACVILRRIVSPLGSGEGPGDGWAEDAALHGESGRDGGVMPL